MNKESTHLHVVQAVDSLRGGGLGSSLLDLNHEMARMGVSSTIVATSGQSSSRDGLRLFRRVPPHRAFVAPQMGIESARLVASAQFVHFHGLFAFPNAVLGREARRQDVPMVYHPHGMLEPWALARSKRKKALVRLLYENANFRAAALWRALSVVEAEQVAKLGLPGRVVIIPNGIDLSVRSNAASEYRGAPYLLFLGRLHPKKGLLMLVEAWSRVSSRFPDWQLVIAGPDESGHRAEVEKAISDFEVTASVVFVGEVHGPEKQRLLASARGLVLPSLSEGHPMVVLEAMAASRPVLVTEASNMPEVAQYGAGVVVLPDTSGLEAGLAGLLELGPGERQAMGERGRTLVEERYSLRVIATQLHEACINLLP